MVPQPVTEVEGQYVLGGLSREDLRHTNLLQKGLPSPNLTGWIRADKVSWWTLSAFLLSGGHCALLLNHGSCPALKRRHELGK